MTDFVWPSGVIANMIEWRHLSNSEVFRAPFSGGVQTVARPGDRLGCTVTVRNATGQKRAVLRALSGILRGRGNRIYIPDQSMRRRGSFPGGELLTSADLSSTTGWVAGSDASIAVADNVLRVSRIANAGGGAAYVQQTAALNANVPYAWRTGISAVRGAATLRNTSGAVLYSELDNGNTTTPGYRRTWLVGEASTQVFADNVGAANSLAGDFYDLSFASLSRCALVDGGGNLLLRSEEFDNAAWTKSNCSVTANATSAPNGTATGDQVIENAATSFHYVEQASAGVTASVQDICFCVAVRAATRSFCFLEMTENTGPTSVNQYFNLGSSGSVGVNGATGANWTNRRAFVRSLGNISGTPWILCCLIARKTNAATNVTFRIGSATADGTGSYTGSNGVAGISLWRGTGWPSSFPVQLIQSTTAAIAAASQSTSAIAVKGLPVSTNGLLLAGEAVEIDKQLKFLAARLDSDSAGNGVLQFDSPPARALADNHPVIVFNPMAKMYLTRDMEYPTQPGDISDFTFDFEQDLAA